MCYPCVQADGDTGLV